MDARGAAAVMCGLLDARGAITSKAREYLVNEATESGDAAVRKLAYTAIAEARGVAGARALAEHDPNAQVRAWGLGLREPSGESEPGPRRGRPRAERPKLF